jgi:aspartate/methionine/tyrosine aminotransferase
VVTPPGLAQTGAAAALREPLETLRPAVTEWERRRDVVVAELAGLPVRTAAGGWSLLLETAVLGLDSFAASSRLLEIGRVAATPMRDWGEVNGDRFVRLVFSNEPVARLTGLGARVRRALTG